jgi:hypothetical protein
MECSVDADCGNDFHSENYCLEGDVYNDFHDSICDHNQCFEDTFPKLVKECSYGCANGDCITQEEPECGNGITEEGEECDDGNLIGGDGCDSNCMHEKECCDNEDCPADYYGTNYCLDEDVYQDLNDFFCSLTGTCEKNIFTELKQDCGEDYCNEWGDYYCEGKNKIRERTCYDNGCSGGECFNNLGIEKQSEECSYGCTNGDCMPETCSFDNDCPNDSYTDKYCSEGDVYRNFEDYSCNGSCSVNIMKQLVEECENGCSSGTCDEEDDGDNNGDRRKTDEKSENEIFDSSASGIPFADYSNLDIIDLSTKSDAGVSVSKKIPFWLWILAALVVLLVLILLVLTYRKI